jgi:hypothetical protein
MRRQETCCTPWTLSGRWWAYTGHGTRPRAAACRSACAGGWRGPPYPIDWDTISEDRLEDPTPPGPTATGGRTSTPSSGSAGRETVPLPEELAETLTRLDEQLYRLAGQAPFAVLKAVATLEGLLRDVATRRLPPSRPMTCRPRRSAPPWASARTRPAPA